jgi:hydroxyethylthiazole kinase-like sugar kinase family protein
LLDLTLHRKRSLLQQIIGAGTTMTSLISVFVITVCDVYTKYHQSGAYAAAENAQAELAHEQTTFVHQYRECLAKKETNPQVDCSEYRTTIEVIEKK